MNNVQDRPTDLATRVFDDRRFQLGWAVFLFLLLISVTEPLRHILLVWVVYGKDAYLHGMRVIPHKPLRFTNGVLVPQLIDIATGFGMFFATTMGLSLALIFALRFYEHRFRKPR